MEYQEHTIDDRLRDYVKVIWTLDLQDPLEFGPPLRILPDGLVEVVFHYDNPFTMRFGDAPARALPSSFAILQSKTFVEIFPTRSSGFLSIRFQPWGVCQFTSQPIAAFPDCLVSPEELWGKAANDLHEAIALAKSSPERASIVQRFLLGQLERCKKVEMEPFVRLIWKEGGQLSISTFSKDLGIGERRLERIFLRSLGVSPKSFARLTRFLSVSNQLRRHDWVNLTDVGQSAGYYDQSHFIYDFKSYSGMTPSEFVQLPNIPVLAID